MEELWETAKLQLEGLRDAVVRSSQIGKIKLDAAFLRRERDQALLALGEIAHRTAKEGSWAVPESLREALAAVEAVERRLSSEEQEIEAIRQERHSEFAKRSQRQ